MIPLAAFEEIIDASGVAPRIEAMLPAGVRRRQLTVRTLLAGMCLTQADGRPAHLTRVHQALVSLPADDQRRLGVLADWKHGPHLLTASKVASQVADRSERACTPVRDICGWEGGGSVSRFVGAARVLVGVGEVVA